MFLEHKNLIIKSFVESKLNWIPFYTVFRLKFKMYLYFEADDVPVARHGAAQFLLTSLSTYNSGLV